MNNRRLYFARLLFRSLQRRWSRLLVASLAMLLGAMLVAALTNLTLDMGSKVGHELRGYGANLIVSPRNADGGRLLSEFDIGVLADPAFTTYLAGYAPFLYGVVRAGDQPVILAGSHLDRLAAINPWWNVRGEWPDSSGADVIVGVNVARQLGLAVGDAFVVEHQAHQRRLSVAGIVDNGASEDDQIFASLNVAQEVLDRSGAVSLVQVSAMTTIRTLPETARAIEQAWPSARVKILGQIAEAEESVFRRIQLLMALVAALVLAAAAVTIASTTTTSVLERTPEIGLMKALGAGEHTIGALFLVESIFVGLCGGVTGYVLGLVAAQLIASSVFQSALSVQWLTLPATIGIAVLVAVTASIVPVFRALSIEPAIILRGD